jgi:hypothetical protein
MTGKTKAVEDNADSDELDRDVHDDLGERPYYYDDAHGYQEFDPNEADGPDDENSDAKENLGC